MSSKRIIKRRPRRDRIVKGKLYINKPYPKRKFNVRRRRIFYEAVKKRLPVTRAVELAGISFTAYRRWMNLGKGMGYPIQRRFRLKVKKLEAQNEQECLDIIRDAGQGGSKVVETKIVVGSRGQETTRTWKVQLPQWQAAAWYLERRLRLDYTKDITEADQKKSAEEIAREVKDALDALSTSVPTDSVDLELPEDMPE